MREELKLRVFEKRVCRRIFGLKRDEVTGEWRSLMISSGRVTNPSQRPLTTHNTHNRQTSMPPVGFEPKISAGEWP